MKSATTHADCYTALYVACAFGPEGNCCMAPASEADTEVEKRARLVQEAVETLRLYAPDRLVSRGTVSA